MAKLKSESFNFVKVFFHEGKRRNHENKGDFMEEKGSR